MTKLLTGSIISHQITKNCTILTKHKYQNNSVFFGHSLCCSFSLLIDLILNFPQLGFDLSELSFIIPHSDDEYKVEKQYRFLNKA